MPRYLDQSECKRLLQATKHNPHLHAFITLALNTGCRSGELLTLTWDNVHLNRSYLTIRNTLSKNGRTVHKPLNNASKQALCSIYTHNHWVFYNPKTDNRIISLKKGFATAVKNAHIGHCRIHDLRHTFASFLVQEGIPLYHVMQLLGHSDIKTTQRYAHLSKNNLSDCLAVLPSFD